MSFLNSASMRRTCLVAVGVLISTSALAQRGGRQDAPPPASFDAPAIARRELKSMGRLSRPGIASIATPAAVRQRACIDFAPKRRVNGTIANAATKASGQW